MREKNISNKDKTDNILKEPIKSNIKKNKYFTKKNIILIFIPVIISLDIYLIKHNPNVLELNQKIEELQKKIENLNKEVIPKKIGIAFINSYLCLNGIARYITVLSDLLVKTGNIMYIL